MDVADTNRKATVGAWPGRRWGGSLWWAWFAAVAVAVGPGNLRATPVIINQPADVAGQVGGQAFFGVVAAGDGPLLYQWKHNGINIPGAVDNQLVIFGLEISDAGSYTVAVQDNTGAVLSTAAQLRFTFPFLSGGDDFSQSVFLQGRSLTVAGRNLDATREPGEPLHGGKVGLHSVWYVWTSPVTGVATLDTVGSAFDTLLGVYQGADVSQLLALAGDDDYGGFYTSFAQLNVEKGQHYYFAVDGSGDAQGDYLFTLSAVESNLILPVITRHPESITVPSGSRVVLRATVSKGENATYQWYFKGQALSGATEISLVLPEVKSIHVGDYYLEIRLANQPIVRSRPATVEIGSSGNVQSVDKIGDLLTLEMGFQGLNGSSSSLTGGGGSTASFFSPGVGSIIAQTINNTNSGGDLTVSPHCSIIGGADRWITLTPIEDGYCQIDTIGSAIDTVIAVYLWSGSIRTTLERPIECNNDIVSPPPPSLQSRVQFFAVAGSTYWVALDGRYAAEGEIQFNLRLGLPPHSPLTDPPPEVCLPMGGSRRLESAFEPNAFPLDYQWYHNGTALSGASSDHLLLTGVDLADAGMYSVRASNWAGSQTVNVTRLLVNTMILGPIRMDGSGRATFTFRGSPGQWFLIEATRDFNVWTRMAEGQLLSPDPAYTFIDFDSRLYTHRFYRVRPILP